MLAVDMDVRRQPFTPLVTGTRVAPIARAIERTGMPGLSEEGQSNQLGVWALGAVAAMCVVGVIWIAIAEPAQTTTKTSTPVAVSPAVTTPNTGTTATSPSKTPTTPTPPQPQATAVQPQATSTTTDKSSTALSVLATIASAAVGGIAGMLRAAPPKKRDDEP